MSTADSVRASRLAVLQALVVTMLWSSSWVLIKFGLAGIPALTFAGLRYALAALCLLPFLLRGDRLVALRRLDRAAWARLAGLGVLYYAVTQGAQFLGLQFLPAVAVSLMLNFTPIVVAVLGLTLLGERPTRRQWLGVAVNLAGVLVYFLPVALTREQWLGVGVMALCTLANALSAVLGRKVNREAKCDALTITAASMCIGSALLLGTGLAVQGLPPLSATHWAIVGWLAVVNTAGAFTLWNHTLRTLTATESSLINSTMLVQIALLAWVFLGEGLSVKAIVGLVLAGVGVLLVQLK